MRKPKRTAARGPAPKRAGSKPRAEARTLEAGLPRAPPPPSRQEWLCSLGRRCRAGGETGTRRGTWLGPCTVSRRARSQRCPWAGVGSWPQSSVDGSSSLDLCARSPVTPAISSRDGHVLSRPPPNRALRKLGGLEQRLFRPLSRPCGGELGVVLLLCGTSAGATVTGVRSGRRGHDGHLHGCDSWCWPSPRFFSMGPLPVA